MTDATPGAHPPGSIGWLKTVTRDLTGRGVLRITAPGGPGRASMRVELEDGTTVIATRRASAARAAAEHAVLDALAAEGAPVPAPIGFADGLLLQTDVGAHRLSTEMAGSDTKRRVALAAGALAALDGCRAAIMRRPELVARLPGLGIEPAWAEEFVSRPVFLSGDLGIAQPKMDFEAVATALAATPSRFLRWNAPLAKASVQDAGTVIWYDWSLTGRRTGVEDVAWAVSDPAWGLDRATTDGLIEGPCDGDADAMAMVRRMATLLAANRLARMTASLRTEGWADAATALRQGRDAPVAENLPGWTARMSELCADDAHLGGFAPWFAAVPDAMARLAEPAADRRGDAAGAA
ncbi:hypothetical protein [uncultured Jannaschia sp.]|uniref:hypothetical protein n=1 Tax=uncultured Jannaschia sp. TaxID=293347 RepID=UPI00261BC457|nr:hypothetical protein [uncultured Jannaschia sp.]